MSYGEAVVSALISDRLMHHNNESMHPTLLPAAADHRGVMLQPARF